MQRDRRWYALHPELGERPVHPRDRAIARLGRDDELGEHRVVVGRDVPALPHPRVHPDERPGGLAIGRDASGSGQEVPRRVLRIDPALDRVATRADVRHVEPVAERHADLERDEVDAGDHLGHGVLHLEARVHLEEVELAVLVDDALDRAGIDVAGLLRQGHRGVADPCAQLVVDDRRGCLLDQLLVPALDRAVTFAEEGDVAAGIREHLRLDVVRAVDVALEEDLGPAEVRLRLARRTGERLLELLGFADGQHALAAAAERGFHEHRVADPVGLGGRVGRGDGLRRAGDDRHPDPVGRPPRGGLVTHHLDRVRGWADEGEPRVGDRSGEMRTLGEEPVPRVDHRGPGLRGGLEDLADRQVRVRRQRRADPLRLIGHLDVERIAVGVAVDGDRGVAELSDGADDAHGDLAAVGDQDPGFGHMPPAVFRGALRQPIIGYP